MALFVGAQLGHNGFGARLFRKDDGEFPEGLHRGTAMGQPKKTRTQSQQRKAGTLKRVEVVLHRRAERVRVILDHLETLHHGEASKWIRNVLVSAIAAQRAPVPDPADDTAAAGQLEALIAEVAALRLAVHEPAVLGSAQSTPVPPPTQIAAEASTHSTGIDTSRPRRQRVTARVVPSLPTALGDLAAGDVRDRLRVLLTSMKQYGQEHQHAAAS